MQASSTIFFTLITKILFLGKFFSYLGSTMGKILVIVALLGFFSFAFVVSEEAATAGDPWQAAHATFYAGAAGASGTMAPPANLSYQVGGFTFIQGAAAKGALCLDGSIPAYHFRAGFGSGVNNWLVDFEGGGWCNDIESCLLRKTTPLGSTTQMKRVENFTGILSNIAQENPDFFNWNMVKLRHCDGASFAGEGENKAAGLFFRGQRIFQAAMDELMAKGMRHANQALLSGGSAGGVAVILHCDGFRKLFPATTRVKCISDAGLFMDTVDVSGGHNMRSRVHGVVSLQGVQSMLPRSCIRRLGPVSCFFPQHLINYVSTPLFILNAAYDWIQVQAGIAPNQSDPLGKWNNGCKLNFANCSTSQIQTLQEFRNRMIKAVKGFGVTRQNGVFINSCFAHCQAYNQVTWLSSHGPKIENEGISAAVSDWYFDRSKVKKIGCPYPCEKTCHNDVLSTSPF